MIIFQGANATGHVTCFRDDSRFGRIWARGTLGQGSHLVLQERWYGVPAVLLNRSPCLMLHPILTMSTKAAL